MFGRSEALSRGEWVLALRTDQVKGRDQNADGDEAIGEIECGPVVTRPVEVEEIDDFTVNGAINEITDDTPENKRERGNQAGFSGVRLIGSIAYLPRLWASLRL